MSKSLSKLPGPGYYENNCQAFQKSKIKESPKIAFSKAYKKFDIIKCKINRPIMMMNYL